MRRALLLRFVAAACCTAAAGLTAAAAVAADAVATAGVVTARAAATPSDPGAGSYRLQMPGDFHGDEPVARDGQRWLALRVDAEGRARLEPTRLRLLTIEDPVLDAPGSRTGRRVESSVDDALAYVLGPNLRSGWIEAAVIDPLDDPARPDARIVFAGRDYRLHTECAPGADAASPQAGQGAAAETPTTEEAQCRIVLRHGAASALITETALTRVRGEDGSLYTRLGDDASPQLLFAGDLDRDGQLDLLFDVTDHYNLQLPTLFLSSGPSSSAPSSGAPLSSGASSSGRSQPGTGTPGPSSSSPSTPGDTPPAPTAGEALPLRAVAEYRSVGC